MKKGFSCVYSAKFVSAVLSKGFTLIELLVVVLIIGILAAIAVPQYQAVVAQSRWAGFLSLARSVKTAQEAFYMANGVHAEEFPQLDISLPPGGSLQEHHGQQNSQVRYPDGLLITNSGSAPAAGWGSSFLYIQHAKNQEVRLMIPYTTTHVPECRAYNELGRKVCVGMGGKEGERVAGFTIYTL